MDKVKVEQAAAGSNRAASRRLDSWKDIAQYLNRDVRTAQRWEKSDGLPVHRLAGGRQKGSPVYAFTSEIDAWLNKNPSSIKGEEADSHQESKPMRSQIHILLTILVLVVLLAGALVGWHVLYPKNPAPTARAVSLTTYPGVERYPALSWDGDKIAFSWNGKEQDNPDIYVRSLDGGEPRRLTSHPGVDGWPIWSPDGSRIAFGRWMPGWETGEILIVPSLGGAERKIHEFPLPYQAANYWPPGCWTPDGKWLIVSVAPAALGLVSPETLEVRPITKPEAGSLGDYGPALSPDGRYLAFLRAASGPIWNLFIQKLDSDYRPEGLPRQLTREPAGVENPMWTGDGREVLFISNKNGERALYRIPYDGSGPESQVPTLNEAGYFWTISRKGDRLAYANNKWNLDIWRIDLEGEKKISPVQFSTREDINPQISPDGNRIAFLSNHDKGMRLWISDADGSNPISLASVNGKRIGPARWSPDGEELVFECRDNGRDDICVVPAGGGTVRRLTRSPGRYTLPSWSRDKKWIYVTSNRSGSFQIWKIPSDGSDTGSRRLTKGGGYAAVESEDGKNVFFSREMMNLGLWSVPADGGEESEVGSFKIYQSYTYALCKTGIYYGSTDNREKYFDLWFYRFSDGKSEHVRRINMRLEGGMSISPDNRYLLFTAAKGGDADLIMVENFR